MSNPSVKSLWRHTLQCPTPEKISLLLAALGAKGKRVSGSSPSQAILTVGVEQPDTPEVRLYGSCKRCSVTIPKEEWWIYSTDGNMEVCKPCAMMGVLAGEEVHRSNGKCPTCDK